MKVLVHFDGGCRTSMGIAAGAAVVYDEAGNELKHAAKVLHRTTTPVAEYTGLILGLRMASELGAREVECMGDAELIVRQVDGRYNCTKQHLMLLRNEVWRLGGLFDKAIIREFPKGGPQNKRRHGNVRADALAGEAMDLGRDINPLPVVA